MMLKKYRAMVLILLLGASLPVVAMEGEERDQYSWSPYTETLDYRQAIQQAIDAKRETGHSDNAAVLAQQTTSDTELDQQVLSGEEQKASAENEKLDPKLVGWVNAMGDGSYVVANALHQESSLPQVLQQMISEYQDEWRVVKNIPCSGHCEGSCEEKTMISRGIYEGQESIFIPFKKGRKPILSATNKGALEWYLGIINSETYALQAVRLNCVKAEQWPVISFPLSRGLVTMTDDGQVQFQWHGSDQIGTIPCTAQSLVMLSEDSIALGSIDGHLQIWALDKYGTFGIEHDLTCGDKEGIISIATLPSHNNRSQFLASCSVVIGQDGTAEASSIKVWNVHTKKYLEMIQTDPARAWRHVIAMPDGETIVASNLRDIEAWNCQTGESLGRVPLERAMPDDGVRIAPISNDEVAVLSVGPRKGGIGDISCIILNIRTGNIMEPPFATAGARVFDTIVGLSGGKVLVRRDNASTMVCKYSDHYSDALRSGTAEMHQAEFARSAGVISRMKRFMKPSRDTKKNAQTKKHRSPGCFDSDGCSIQ